MIELNIDLETFSTVDIGRGTDNYAHAAEIMLFAYAAEDDTAVVWDRTLDKTMPGDLRDMLRNDGIPLIAHNAAFERSVLAASGYKINPNRYRCTMAHALAHGLPGGLEQLCNIFNIGEDKAKLKDGKALVRLFCIPQSFKNPFKREMFAAPKDYREAVAKAKDQWTGRATKESHPVEWERFKLYCGTDVEAMREVRRKMPNWNYKGAELELWHLDQRINQRGVCIDTDLVNGALLTAERVKAALAEETMELTDNALSSTTKRDALLKLLRDVYDIDMPDMRASRVESLLKMARSGEQELPEVVVQLLENRLAASTTSVSKYKAFGKLMGADGRLRNTLQFCGASRTGRWAGRGVQLQNLPRPTLKQKAIDTGILAIKANCADLIYDNPMVLLSSSVRGAIIAPEGKKLVVADLSNIEGRMLAFLAGEEWKLQAFRDFDTCMGTDGQWYTGDQIRDAVLAGNPLDLKLDKKGEPTRKGHDLYALAYAKAFNITPEEVMENKKSGDGSMRQIGKVMELALGYEGGVGAFVTFAVAYGIDLDEMANNAIQFIPKGILEEAKRAHAWAVKNKRDYNMAPVTYIVCDSFKRMWRNAHPKTAAFWKALETAFRNACVDEKTDFKAGAITLRKRGKWMKMTLPSGRSLCYPSPRLDENDKISYMGINQFSRQWNRLKTYSGKLAENATQAASRDIIGATIPSIELAGYDIVSLVHDEDITESPDTDLYSADHLAALMASNPPWATGLPLAAAGFESYTYKKD